MYKDELQIEISKALTTYSDLDYDVAMTVASIYIVLREKQSQEDAMDYHLFRVSDGYHQQLLRLKQGSKSRPSWARTRGSEYKWHIIQPTTIILMNELFPSDHPNMENTTFVKTYDYENAFRYFQRDPCHRHNLVQGLRHRNIREKASQIARTTQHELYKNILNIIIEYISNWQSSIHGVARTRRCWRELYDAIDDSIELQQGSQKRYGIRSPFTAAEDPHGLRTDRVRRWREGEDWERCIDYSRHPSVYEAPAARGRRLL